MTKIINKGKEIIENVKDFTNGIIDTLKQANYYWKQLKIIWKAYKEKYNLCWYDKVYWKAYNCGFIVNDWRVKIYRQTKNGEEYDAELYHLDEYYGEKFNEELYNIREHKEENEEES